MALGHTSTIVLTDAMCNPVISLTVWYLSVLHVNCQSG
jgi:hypothetical protein